MPALTFVDSKDSTVESHIEVEMGLPIQPGLAVSETIQLMSEWVSFKKPESKQE